MFLLSVADSDGDAPAPPSSQSQPVYCSKVRNYITVLDETSLFGSCVSRYVHLPHFKNTLLTYLQPLGQVLEKYSGYKKNLNRCHQMPFLGSKYAKIAYSRRGGEEGGKRRGGRGGKSCAPLLKSLDPPLAFV